MRLPVVPVHSFEDVTLDMEAIQSRIGGLGYATSSGVCTAGAGSSTSPAALGTVPSLTIAVGSPTGATVFLSGGWSCFTTVNGSLVTWYYKIDSGSFVTLDGFGFNVTSTHLKSALFSTVLPTLSHGTHTISWGFSVGAAQNITFNTADFYSFTAQEMLS